MRNFVFFALISSCILFSSCQNRSLYRQERILLGTLVEVISPYKEAGRIVFQEIERIENLLSIYNENSEISKLNKLGELKVSKDTFFVIEKAKWFWQETQGAFDITVEPLLKLWGFKDNKFRIPTQEEIKDTLNYVGTDKIILHPQQNMVKFISLGVKIDLGGIAKGYAVDCAVKKLKEKNIKSCLINAGGDIFALGDKFGKPWKIAIKNPKTGTIMVEYLALKDKAVATSGDYEQFFVDEEGRAFCHIIDPKTGLPLRVSFSSVTVIADDCLTADALATAFFILGEEKTKELLKKFPGVEAKFIN